MIIAVVTINVYAISFKNFYSPEGPNVILISIDTLRADRLGSYGHNRDTTPNIDSVAAKGVVFENAYSQAPWTLPAMATMHTSLYPTEHGAVNGRFPIKKNLNTIAEYMKNKNFKTMAITTHPYVDIKHGFAQGFDIFFERVHEGAFDTSAGRITQKGIELLNENHDKKFFLWLHYFDPHSAYLNHKEFNYAHKPEGDLPESFKASTLNKMVDELEPDDLKYVSDVYDEEISYTDRNIGEVIDTIDSLGLTEDTVIIITSDHGEELLERSRFGTRQKYISGTNSCTSDRIQPA